MLSPNEAKRLGQKYTERHGAISDTMIKGHLGGAITLAAPAADVVVIVDVLRFTTAVSAARLPPAWTSSRVSMPVSTVAPRISTALVAGG